MQHFKALSLSYKNTPITVREHVSLDESTAKQLIGFIRDYVEAYDLLVLSTCNRTEIYYTSERDCSVDILKGLALIKKEVTFQDIDPFFVRYNDQDEAVQHLFDVAIGLEAQVVGDMQISNQVKQAYQWSADEQMAGPFLHRLMHTIFFTNKRVVQETPFRDGAASVSYAAKELVEDLAGDLASPKILVMGLGEIGADLCRNLSGSKFNDVKITNRTISKAQELGEECGFEVVPFEQINETIADADIIISSIVKDEPFITKQLIEQFEILSHKFFIDLSVPRSVESAIEDVHGVLVYNIDNIHSKASDALQTRLAAIPDVRVIIKEAIEEFNDWSKEMIVSPTIQKLKNALEDIRSQEMVRFLKNASDEEAKMIDKVTKSMMQKVIKLPVLQLKAACKRGEADTLIDVLNDLFNLEQQPVKKEK
ncbi:MAG: glutamyl-tRNA reductase [Bacteroidota bacterium]